jgi:hypothetical protein
MEIQQHTISRTWMCVLHSTPSLSVGLTELSKVRARDLVLASKRALRFVKGPGNDMLTHPGTTLSGYSSSFNPTPLDVNLFVNVTFFTMRQIK